ncbi:MAG: hypothetical protein KA172_03255 [Paludibacter sp.]|nr:hypothetical protein [Paludibacter sp.]
MLTAGANSIVPLHCTSLDLHQPQHRTAKVAPSFRYTKPNSSIPQAVINPNHKA